MDKAKKISPQAIINLVCLARMLNIYLVSLRGAVATRQSHCLYQQYFGIASPPRRVAMTIKNKIYFVCVTGTVNSMLLPARKTLTFTV